MDKKIIIGNMKTYMNYSDVLDYILSIKDHINYSGVILLPSNIYLSYFKDLNVKLGLQDIGVEAEGAYTGEILPRQALSMGIRYTLVGHSERRISVKESNTIINKKLKAALPSMGVVLCVGETKEEKSLMDTKDVLKRQIFTALKGVTNLKNLVIAYEPVWAIGTGKTPKKRELEKNIKFIKDFVKEIAGYDIKVLYGGSVSSENIDEFKDVKGLDGFLVGGASCNADEFIKIIESFN